MKSKLFFAFTVSSHTQATKTKSFNQNHGKCFQYHHINERTKQFLISGVLNMMKSQVIVAPTKSLGIMSKV
jgi:hypothetical protein